jgi:hypothetical protein
MEAAEGDRDRQGTVTGRQKYRGLPGLRPPATGDKNFEKGREKAALVDVKVPMVGSVPLFMPELASSEIRADRASASEGHEERIGSDTMGNRGADGAETKRDARVNADTLSVLIARRKAELSELSTASSPPINENKLPQQPALPRTSPDLTSPHHGEHHEPASRRSVGDATDVNTEHMAGSSAHYQEPHRKQDKESRKLQEAQELDMGMVEQRKKLLSEKMVVSGDDESASQDAPRDEALYLPAQRRAGDEGTRSISPAPGNEGVREGVSVQVNLPNIIPPEVLEMLLQEDKWIRSVNADPKPRPLTL